MGLSDRRPPTQAEYDSWRERFSNWGRWGADDELGTVNFVTPEVRRAAGKLVVAGRSVSLARPIDTHASPRNPFPAHHMIPVGSSGGLVDYIGMFIHGYAHTHLDALSHIPTADGSAFYNGRPRSAETNLPKGATSGVDFWREGIATRGVLYDVPRLRGAPYVRPGEPIHAWDLEDAAKRQGITPRAGDAVVIRGGLDPYLAAHPDGAGFASPAGVHASVLEFLWEHDASMLVWDMLEAPTADQGIANPLAIHSPVHVHCIAIPYMGLALLDNAQLEPLAALCAELGRWEFLLVVAPLVIPGGTGSPVNPIALL
jgi:kynurenine formamidase